MIPYHHLPNILLLFLISPLAILAIPFASNDPPFTGNGSSLPYNPQDLNTPCGLSNPDCPDPLTCIPLSKNCTVWTTRYTTGCAGTCQYLDPAKNNTRKYTVCGGWALADDCYESREVCIADPRTSHCGISCDGKGLCHPFREMCEGNTGRTCDSEKGEECFYPGQGLNRTSSSSSADALREFCVSVYYRNGTRGKKCGGVCLPLRFGSDYYPKSLEEEVTLRNGEQDGWNGVRPQNGARLWDYDDEEEEEGPGKP